MKVSGLSLGYEGKCVVNDLSFVVNPGDFLSIIGENGSGKTTLVKGLLGLIRKFSGTIELSDSLVQSNIGYLSQKNMINKDFPASVEEVVMSGFLNTKFLGLFYSKAQRKVAEELMNRVGIISFRKANFSELSGGQQQRVLLCRALCATQKLILLDEPTTGLDPLASADFYSLLSELNRDGVTVIMVSHDVNEALRMSSHILYLSKEESFFGTTHQYLHSDVGKKLIIDSCPCDNCSRNIKGGAKNA